MKNNELLIVNKQSFKENLIDSGYAETLRTFAGSMNNNVTAKEDPEIVAESVLNLTNKAWENTELYNDTWNSIEDLQKKYKQNTASFSQTDYYELIDKIRLDITRRRFEYPDLTTMIDTPVVNEGFSKSVSLDEFLPYAAAFKQYGMNNESVSLIDQKYGATGSVEMVGYAVGWKDTLDNQLFNSLFSMQRINEAVARGFVAKRNDLSAGEIVGKTFDASQKVAAATGATLTAEELLYQTLNSGIETLTNLKDPQTDQLIMAPQIYCLCNPGDVRRINRAINGQLNNSKGATANRGPLEINALIPYKGDSITVGKKTYTYSGVDKNTAYLYVPMEASWSLVKRGLQQEVGKGSVLQLSTQEMAWYFVQTSYRREFFGSSDSAINASLGEDYGYIVEVTLPSA